MKNATRSLLLVALLLLASASFAKAAMLVAPIAPVSFRNAMSDAMTLSRRYADSRVMRISGTSMLPYFGNGSLIVVKPISAERLRKGMVVVYRNNFGETVAHRLVGHSATGWIAKGYNNVQADSTPVTAANLVGVVYATFNTAGMVASNENSVSVAMAAPAR